MKPLVSIIITTYKRHDFLKRAIDSVLNQTYSNIELLVVDDNDFASEYSASVQKLVKDIQTNDKRIRYISMQKNQGACAARNKGFQESKGEFIDFLDDDDEFYREKIELQIEKFASCNPKVGTVGCFAEIRDGKGNVIQYDRNRIKGDVFFANLCHSICQTSIPLIKREVFEASGGFENIISSQEHLMLARVFDVCPYYDYVEKELVKIYHHNGVRISNSRSKPQGAIELAEKFKRYYYKLSDEQIQELELAMNANIINAYLLVNKRKEAYQYLRYRRNIKSQLSMVDLKLIAGILFGSNVKKIVHKIFK